MAAARPETEAVMAEKCINKTGGVPLFALLRSVPKQVRNKICYLLRGERIHFANSKTNILLTVLRRLLRDAPIQVSKFCEVVKKLTARYRVRNHTLGVNEHFRSELLIGDVRLVGTAIETISNPAVAKLRDAEFKRKKYRNFKPEHLSFLISLFELTELTKQMSRVKA